MSANDPKRTFQSSFSDSFVGLSDGPFAGPRSVTAAIAPNCDSTVIETNLKECRLDGPT